MVRQIDKGRETSRTINCIVRHIYYRCIRHPFVDVTDGIVDFLLDEVDFSQVPDSISYKRGETF
jgi:hypothetical protein